MGKSPRFAKPPAPTKTPRTGSVDPKAFAGEPMFWALGRVDLHGRWGWRTLIDADLSELHRLLVGLEGSTPSKLKQQQKLRQIPTDQLCPDAQHRLVAIKREEFELWELRLGFRKWRVWGILVGSTFFFLWWDPDHTVYGDLPKSLRRGRSN